MKRLVVVTHYPLLPADFGGPIRAMALDLRLMPDYDLEFFSLSIRTPFRRAERVSDATVRFFFRPLYTLAALPLWARGLPYGALLGFAPLLGRVPRRMRKALTSADLVIVEEPHLFRWLHRAAPSSRFLLNEHNVEYDLESSNLEAALWPLRRVLLRAINRTERYALSHAQLVTVVSDDNARRLQGLYGTPAERFHVIPNGYDQALLAAESRSVPRASIDHVDEVTKVVLFMGSEHKPNRDALTLIENYIAPRLRASDMVLVIVGAVARDKAGTRAGNMVYAGCVDDIVPYLRRADLAINPMRLGSGSNLKMIDYLGAGLPVVSTPFGARGIGEAAGLVVREITEFPTEIAALLGDDQRRAALGRTGAAHVAEHLSWDVVASAYRDVVASALAT